MRRVAHIKKSEMVFHSQAQKHDGITITPITEIYWCGRSVNLLREEPNVLTEEEQKEFAKFEREQELNPWPVCSRCKIKKDREEKKKAEGRA